MFGSTVLEVLVGVVLVYVLLSLVCSTVTEMLASWRNWRGKTLKQAVERLVDPPSRCAQGVAMSKQIFEHPLVRSLYRGDRLPSYVPNETFAEALVDCIAPSNGPSATSARALRVIDSFSPGNATTFAQQHPELQRSLTTLFQRAQERMDTQAADRGAEFLRCFKREVGDWYEQTMQRAIGWYKRHTQLHLVWISVVVVAIANADTISIAEQLSLSPTMREAVANAAQGFVETKKAPPAGANTTGGAATPELGAADLKPLYAATTAAGLKFGWSRSELARIGDETTQDELGRAKIPAAWFWWRKVIGLLITMVAVTLGAPFWFQVLDKLVKLRGSGVRPGATDDKAPSSGGDDPAKLAASAGKSPAPGTIAPANGATPTIAAQAAARLALPPSYWEDAADRMRAMKSLPQDELGRTLIAARMAALAYKPAGNARALLERMGFGAPQFFDSHGTQAFAVEHSSGDVVVAFRGTETSELQDLLADARAVFLHPTFADEVRVHGGFWHALGHVADDIDKWLKPRLAAQKRVIVTGHSLGGALATLCVCRQPKEAENLELVTFGSPRVGDQQFQQFFDRASGKEKDKDPRKRRCLRIVNDQDLVTRVAPRALGYCHVGDTRFFDSMGRLTQGDDEWNRFLLLVLDAAADFQRAAKGTLRDHAMDLYLARLESFSQRG